MEANEKRNEEDEVPMIEKELSKAKIERRERAIRKLLDRVIALGRKMEEHPERFEQKWEDGER